MTKLFQAKFLVMIIISFPLFSLANHHGNINTNWKETELFETYNCSTLRNLKQDELLKTKKLRLSEKKFYDTVIIDLDNTIKTGSGRCGFNPEHDNKINRIISVAKSKCETQNVSRVDLGLKYHAVYKCNSTQVDGGVNIAFNTKSNNLPKPYLGIRIGPIKEGTKRYIKKNFKINLSGQGVYAEDVNLGGPAYLAGFERGDILLAIDGVKIINIDHMASLTVENVERSVVITVLRNGLTKFLPVKIIDRNEQAKRDQKQLREKQKRKEVEAKKKKEIAKKRKEKEQAIKKLESKKITLGMGSGFWFNNQGYFATNHHVIEGCKTTQIKLNNELVNSKIISFDKINDLAIGKVDKNIESVFLLSDKPELGEDVMVGGFPLSGVLQNDSIKITRGIVSSLSGFNNNYSMLQIDAPIQKGNSGGPIINSKGEVIGIATLALKSTREYEAQNVNFGVKVNLLRNMVQSLGIDLTNKQKLKTKNSKQLAKALEKNTIHIHCTNTFKQWVAHQNNQNTDAKLSEHIKLNLKDYMK